jgi:hypothetical protein
MAIADVEDLPGESIAQIVAADLFVVPTATYRLLFVPVILAHERRRIVQIRRSVSVG